MPMHGDDTKTLSPASTNTPSQRLHPRSGSLNSIRPIIAAILGIAVMRFLSWRQLGRLVRQKSRRATIPAPRSTLRCELHLNTVKKIAESRIENWVSSLAKMRALQTQWSLFAIYSRLSQAERQLACRVWPNRKQNPLGLGLDPVGRIVGIARIETREFHGRA